jgi:hypothetical protein
VEAFSGIFAGVLAGAVCAGVKLASARNAQATEPINTALSLRFIDYLLLVFDLPLTFRRVDPTIRAPFFESGGWA